ncbi:MAG: acetyl-CoA carboxylase biotin carboxyl carrier protein subunit [Tunicatimonas sp.]|uniref:acetyl-CoA carboxylase biotin carboxyl carrier protein subunit n=1 Tax=Tunicatimonas sp. TaxID=1940096 RepID=UPI003C78BB44
MYQATINNTNTLTVEVNPESIKINKQEVPLNIHQLSESFFHIIHQHKSYRAEVIEVNYDTKQFVISVNGKKVSIQLQSDLDKLLETLGMDATLEAVVKEVRSPMPGLIRGINIDVGSSVEAGDKLLTLEAMKMENIIKSPTSGTVAAISVKTGQSVEKNQVLVSFE